MPANRSKSRERAQSDVCRLCSFCPVCSSIRREDFCWKSRGYMYDNSCKTRPSEFRMRSPHPLPKRQHRSLKPIKSFDPKEFLANAGIGRTLHPYGTKQVIFSQGKPAVAVYYIQEGRIRLSVVSKQGKEATIALLGPDDFLGEGCIASNQPMRMATSTAITRCSVLKIKRKETLRVLQRRSSLLVRGDQARTILWMCAILNRQ